jgi:cation diffusion facilitator CzcD-associated flavoprotein CzcO
MLSNPLDIAVIGAGPQALTLTSQLLQRKPKLRSQLQVFDPSGTWLKQWKQQFNCYEIPHLRSPVAHHPATDVFALRRFAESRSTALHPPNLPGSRLFEDFCQDLINKSQLQDHVVSASVAEIIVKGQRSFELLLQDGSIVAAKRVIVATGAGKPVLPEWFEQLEGERQGKQQSKYPSDRLLHASQVDLRQVNCAGERILIVGGGLTTGHLAIGAIARRAHVTLMHRRQFYGKLFDADPNWVKSKSLSRFQAESCWHTKAEIVLGARNGGSLTPTVLAQLRRQEAAGQLEFQENCQVVQVAWRNHQWWVQCSQGSEQTYDRIWVATGSQVNVLAHPLLGKLQAQYPTEIVSGLPVLDRQLRWPGLELFVMGGLASLQLGPTARNLSGARIASDRIVDALTKASLQLSLLPTA